MLPDTRTMSRMHPTVFPRRTFLADLGRGGLALAIVGVVGCVPSDGSASTPSAPGPGPTGASSTGAVPPTSVAGGSGDGPGAGSGGTAWTRVNLGFVSAYILVRAGEAAIIDTGVAGSEGQIEASLASIGLDRGAVGHVILTHKHPDHAGSIGAVLDAAPDAKGYLGAADLPAVSVSRPLTALEDGDRVFDLGIIATPGHTAGHMAVFDEAAGLLVAGDALGNVGGTLTGSNPQFTEDTAAAMASVVKLGRLTFETLLVGHGEPILSGASARVAALGAG